MSLNSAVTLRTANLNSNDLPWYDDEVGSSNERYFNIKYSKSKLVRNRNTDVNILKTTKNEFYDNQIYGQINDVEALQRDYFRKLQHLI